MRIKKRIIILLILIIACIIGVAVWKMRRASVSGEVTTEISPQIGSVRNFISCTGTVLPKNRLEMKPPVNGRVESILVQEGDEVKTGQILAWMSSTERAALLDAARGKGEETLKYWEDAYRPIPLPAPIDAEVIVATTQPGQTITTSDAVLVLSDRLIVRAQVDETDIGKINPEMKALISLDAYPGVKTDAKVEHIYYESKTVNNVTIYEVDLLPDKIPEFFRSGMNATVDFIERGKDNVLLIPLEAVRKENGEEFVLVKQSNGAEPVKTRVKIGIRDDKNAEVLSGITKDSVLIVRGKKYALPKSTSTGTNPFMPFRKR